MVSWGAPPPHPLKFGRWGGVFSLRFLGLALVAVLLASESFPSPCKALSYRLPSFPLPLSVLPGNCTGLSVCACMCARVYTCIERYICGGQGEGRVQLRAWSQDTAHCSLSSALPMWVR